MAGIPTVVSRPEQGGSNMAPASDSNQISARFQKTGRGGPRAATALALLAALALVAIVGHALRATATEAQAEACFAASVPPVQDSLLPSRFRLPLMLI